MSDVFPPANELREQGKSIQESMAEEADELQATADAYREAGVAPVREELARANVSLAKALNERDEAVAHAEDLQEQLDSANERAATLARALDECRNSTPPQATVGAPGQQLNIRTREQFDTLQGKLILGNVNVVIPAGETWTLRGANARLSGGTNGFLQRGGKLIIEGGEWRPEDPTVPTNGLNVENAILRDVEAWGFIDTVNFIGTLETVNCLFRDLAQFPAGTPGVGHSNGSHADCVAAGTGAKSWKDTGSVLRPGPWKHASVTAVMLSPGLPSIDLTDTVIDAPGVIGLNVGPSTAFPTQPRFTRTRWSTLTGPYTPDNPANPKWNGESMIAKSIPRDQLRKALDVAGSDNTRIGGGAVTIKNG